MSKIYDALQRAEEERRRAAGERSVRADHMELARSSVAPAPSVALPATPARRVVPPPASPFEREVEEDLLTLRTTIESVMPHRPRRIALASMAPGEGTTTVLAGFTRLLAADPALRIAVVDTNVVSPHLAEVFGAEPAPGMAEVLAGSATPSSALTALEGLGVHLLACGRADPRHLRPDPEMLERLLSEFGGYDYVLVDCAPLLSWPHSVTVAAACDGVILVARWGRTKREVAGRALETLAAANARVLGVVLNRRQYPIPEFIYRRV
jgi:non-specific protein-tyrosine kinase